MDTGFHMLAVINNSIVNMGVHRSFSSHCFYLLHINTQK